MKKRERKAEKNNRRSFLNSVGFEEPISGLSAFGVKDSTAFEEKAGLRRELIRRRLCLPSEEVDKNSQRISEIMTRLGVFKKANRIALYSPIRNEVRTEPIFKRAVEYGKRVYFPRIEGTILEFHGVDDLGELKPGRFGIPEPRPDSEKIRTEDLDIVVVPGVAFDRLGRRLGYGKGYYDRTLKGIDRERLIGLAYGFQVLDRIPVEAGDIGLGLLIAESGIIFAKGG